MKTPHRKVVFAVIVLLLASLACNLPSRGVATEAAVPTGVQIQPPTAEPTQPPTAEPTVEPTPIPTLAGRLVSFENVEFVVPLGLSQSETGEIVAPITGGAPWDIPVQHLKFTFTGYPLADTSHQPAIYVFPTAGFDMVTETVASLQNLLAQRPAEANPMPLLPPSNTTQMLHAQMKYLDFASGSGVRFLTQSGQGIWPVNNHDLYYTFQGLTADGQYYIAAILPISNTALPASGDSVNLETLTSDYPGYLNGIRTELETRPDDTFTPTVSTLDALVQSITMK